MLLSNQWLDKLAAAHVNFAHRSMLQGTPHDWALLRLGMYVCIIIKCLVADMLCILIVVVMDSQESQLDTGQDLPLPIKSVSINNKRTAVQPATTNEYVGNEDDDSDVVAGPTVEAHVTLAKRPRKFVGCYTT